MLNKKLNQEIERLNEEERVKLFINLEEQNRHLGENPNADPEAFRSATNLLLDGLAYVFVKLGIFKINN